MSTRLAGAWMSPKRHEPDDERDVLAFVSKPVYVDARKRFERMDSMEVIFLSGMVWYLNGKGIDTKHIHKWCEIPEGWQEKN